MTKFIVVILCAVALFTNAGCKKETPVVPPEQLQKRIALSLQDTTCTEAWLQLTFTNFNPPHIYKMYRDTILAFSDTVYANDTTLIDSELLPQHAYTYKVFRFENNVAKDSLSATIRTMDTTSHDFSWTIDTLGGNGSILRDVAIINANNIWAVGEIWMPDGKFYNVARWDGIKWNLEEVKYNYQGQIGSSPMNSVIAFGPNDVWVDTYHWDGNSWTIYILTDIHGGTLNKMWGTSSHDLYIVGSNGAISHFDGTSWTKMESGTDVNLTDIYGTPDGKQVWACGYYSDKRGTFLIKKENNSSWKIVYDGTINRIYVRTDSISGALSTVFVPSINRLMVGTVSGVYLTTNQTSGEAKRLSFTPDYFPGFPTRLRGNGINDITLCGAFSFIGHFNGYTWRNYSDLRTDDIALWSIDQKGNTVVAVGKLQDPINGRAIIIHGKK